MGCLSDPLPRRMEGEGKRIRIIRFLHHHLGISPCDSLGSAGADVILGGYLRKRESSDLEYKENFHRGDDTLKYIKTLVAKEMAVLCAVKN